jgi:hypothetical protein
MQRCGRWKWNSQGVACGREYKSDPIGGLVAILGDECEPAKLLAAQSLQAIGGGTVIATLKAFIDQASSAVAREEAEKVLGRLEES